MLYLVTGTNGAGKTLNTLKWVRDLQLKEGRPVAHNGRFEPVEGGELADWKKIDFKDWQAEPDGTIFLIDECHNDLPLRPPSAIPPPHVAALAEHRRRGFDFFLVTQHPQNMDNFVRRLIGSPGWHRHLKRTFGGDLVSCIEWAAVNPSCEKTGSGKNGTVTMVAFPKQVYSWYKSASLHTGKKKIPKQVWFLAACALVLPVLGYYAYGKIMRHDALGKTPPAVNVAGTGPAIGAAGDSRPPEQIARERAIDYVAVRTPRLASFPHSAPVYDDVTKPQQAPYPAACIQMANTCKCYTQQATVLFVDKDVCQQIVLNGFFMDWQRPDQSREHRQERQRQDTQQPVPLRVSQPAPDPAQQAQPPMSEWSQALANRNSQVRSQFER